jgi:hypothetical protein
MRTSRHPAHRPRRRVRKRVRESAISSRESAASDQRSRLSGAAHDSADSMAPAAPRPGARRWSSVSDVTAMLCVSRVRLCRGSAAASRSRRASTLSRPPPRPPSRSAAQRQALADLQRRLQPDQHEMQTARRELDALPAGTRWPHLAHAHDVAVQAHDVELHALGRRACSPPRADRPPLVDERRYRRRHSWPTASAARRGAGWRCCRRCIHARRGLRPHDHSPPGTAPGPSSRRLISSPLLCQPARRGCLEGLAHNRSMSIQTDDFEPARRVVGAAPVSPAKRRWSGR